MRRMKDERQREREKVITKERVRDKGSETK